MSLQRSRPMDTLQRIMSSFKHFEKKLDKLQDDVNFHGHTLTELRVMVANLSGGILNAETKQENTKHSANKTTAVQPDDPINSNGVMNTKRKNTIQPFISKIQTKSYQGSKYVSKNNAKEVPFINKLPSSPKTGMGGKRASRQRKGEAPRKATTLRSQKEVAKKRSKMPQSIFA
ncbi:unnamed protein product [Leptosia nina]|uniref:Uncharacterized protein n=1 Tax=Leptosia nina TaxID=320188 RepID=A0AAV1JQ92_9NEOP